MQLYAGLSTHFMDDAVHNQIAGKLEDAFFRHYRYRPSTGEVRSWKNSLRAVSQVFQLAGFDDHGVLLEYQLPLTSRRLDCLVCARNAQGADSAVIVELKQWEECEEADGENLVLTWVGGAKREVLHPSAQVRQYQMYLQDTHTAFYEQPGPVSLRSCSYLHNYTPVSDDTIFSGKFTDLLAYSPTFTADSVEPLKDFLCSRLSGGGGLDVLKRVEQSEYRPSKKLMEHVSNVIKGQSEFVLLDEQLVVYQKVLALARQGFRDRRKAVLLVHGGPGTGKSVIAINLMSDLLLEQYNAHYATGSRAFTETLRSIVGTRGAVQFKYFNSYQDAEPSSIDVLICDEAHRLREFSHSRFTPTSERTNKLQIQEILDASKVAVFLIDDRQVVRPTEVGSSELIRAEAKKNDCLLFEHELDVQFRCAGSEGFVNWINNTLGVERTANVLWSTDEDFDFQILDSPEALEEAIREKADEGFSARMTAGFCWPWSKPGKDGTLVPDVQIGNFRRPWNARPNAGRLAPGIPKSNLWAHDPNGLEQVGCVYTAQGFEFDYAGVIVGKDLRYDFDEQGWRGFPEESHDTVVKRSKDQFIDLVKNTYRVLFSRGLKGCYVYFQDQDTERFFRSRMEEAGVAGELTASQRRETPPRGALPFEKLPGGEVKPFDGCAPIYELEIAAGEFGPESHARAGFQGREHEAPERFEWAVLPETFSPRAGVFVAQVSGESMNRRIPNGAWCLFRFKPSGSRQGKVVVARHASIEDAETGGHYTVKVYRSEKVARPDGGWRHKRIVLAPDSSDPSFRPLELEESAARDLQIVAELVAVL